jgi:glycosidase
MKKIETSENERDISKHAKFICGKDGVPCIYVGNERGTT